MTLIPHGYIGQVGPKQWSQILSLHGYEGTDGFEVTAAGGDRMVSIGPGIANVAGLLAVNDDVITRAANPNTSTFGRVDSVVLQSKWGSSELTAWVVPGTPGPNPQPPTLGLTKDPGVDWQLELATVTLAPGQGALTSGNITDRRTPASRGIPAVADLAQAPDPRLRVQVWHYPSQTAYVGDGVSAYVPLTAARQAYTLRRGVTSGGGVAEGIVDFLGTMTTTLVRGNFAVSGSSHSSQFAVPRNGLYRIHSQVWFERSATGQLGYVYLQFRTGTNPGTAASGTVVLESFTPLIGGYVRGCVTLTDDVLLTANVRYHFAVNNVTDGLITVRETSGRSFFAVTEIDKVS